MSCVTLWEPLQTLATNMNMEFGLIVFIVVIIGGILFYVRSPLLGSMFHMLASILCFMWFYLFCWNWSIPLISALLFFVIWGLQLLNLSRSQEVVQ